MRTNFGKTLRYASVAGTTAFGVGGLYALLPTAALAEESGGGGGDPWSPESLITETSTAGITPADVSQSSAESLVKGIAGWVLGIAIALFVLKLVLTAVDRIFIPKGEGQPGRPGPARGSILQTIPVVGAYPPPDGRGGGYGWKEVFINFITQVAICVGAWVIVQFLIGTILWFSKSVL